MESINNVGQWIPFGGNNSGGSGSTSASLSSVSASVSSFETNLSRGIQTSITSTVGSQLSETSKPIEKVVAVSDEKPLLSNDRSNVALLGNKLINLVPLSGQESLLTESEKSLLSRTVKTLETTSSDLRTTTDIAPEVCGILHRLVEANPASHVSAMFLLRLLVLTSSFVNSSSLINELASLVSVVAARVIKDGNGFPSPSAKVMAVCALANIFGNESLLSCLTLGGSGEYSSLQGQLIDIALGGMSDARVEMRQMSSALASNLALHLAATFHAHEKEETSEAAQAGLIQLLLGCIENLADEADAVVRRRKLTIIVRVLRTLGAVGSELASELDLGSSLATLSPKVTEGGDKALVGELRYVVSASSVSA